MPDLTVLLSPADQKQPGGNPFAPDMFDYRTSGTFNYFDDLNPDRRELIDTLQAVVDEEGDEALGEVFGVEGYELEEAIRVNDEIYDAPLMSALDRFSPGVMYAAMDFANLPTGAQRRLLENGVILSGLFGLLRPDDLIPNYQLGMEASLPDVGPVADYWRPIISPMLNESLEDRWVWDLLPEVHRNAWTDEHTYTARVEVQFERVEDGERVPITGEDLEVQRGQFVNFIVQETAEEMEDLREWSEEESDELTFDEDASTYDEDTKTWEIIMVQD
ncbi:MULTISPECIES: YaaA family protein [Salinibacter]|uniref:YaaA family protein n=1 Tax=Salinibacter TaxID=146918 RepID=UPI001ABA415D|nr:MULTISPECIES: YaaA family protein [Salinibacter]